VPVCLLTLHAYGTWNPARSDGYWHHTKGQRPQDPEEGHRYRQRQIQGVVSFSPDLQRFMIQSSLEAAPHLKLIAYCFGSTTTHLHALLGWRDLREEEQVRRKLKEALTRRLNRAFERRAWFVREGWCSSVEDDEHFGHLVETYLPSHPGWFWSRRGGWRGPRIG
jgi:hypothetical protein